MKRAITLALLLFAGLMAQSQTALYKRFAQRPRVYTYCMERYPLAAGDSVCVTLLTTGDSATYRSIYTEVNELPYTPERKKIYVPRFDDDDTQEQQPAHAKQQSRRNPPPKKSLMMKVVDGLEGDRGWYVLCFPSDRMVVLAFLVNSTEEMEHVIRHVARTEFE